MVCLIQSIKDAWCKLPIKHEDWGNAGFYDYCLHSASEQFFCMSFTASLAFWLNMYQSIIYPRHVVTALQNASDSVRLRKQRVFLWLQNAHGFKTIIVRSCTHGKLHSLHSNCLHDAPSSEGNHVTDWSHNWKLETYKMSEKSMYKQHPYMQQEPFGKRNNHGLNYVVYNSSEVGAAHSKDGRNHLRSEW